MRSFRLNNKPYQVAVSWAQLTGAQLLAVAPYLGDDTAVARLHVFRALCPGVPRKLLRKLTDDQLLELLHLVGWVWREPVETAALTHFEHRGTTYLLPEPQLLDAVVIEYAMASLYFRHFAHPTRPRPAALDQLVATLCRPARADLATVTSDPRWDGQRRERYNSKLADARAKELADAPIGPKILVLHHFLAGQRFVHQAYPQLFKKAAPGEDGQPTPPPQSDGTEVLELLHHEAESGTYGTYENVAYTSLHTIFFNLAKSARRRREAEKNQ